MTVAQIRKSLVPVAVLAVGYVAAKLGVDIPADSVAVIAGGLVTALLTYLTPNAA